MSSTYIISIRLCRCFKKFIEVIQYLHLYIRVIRKCCNLMEYSSTLRAILRAVCKHFPREITVPRNLYVYPKKRIFEDYIQPFIIINRALAHISLIWWNKSKNAISKLVLFNGRYCLTTGNRGKKWYQSLDNFRLSGHFPFFILKGHHHKRSVKQSSASSQQLNQPQLAE